MPVKSHWYKITSFERVAYVYHSCDKCNLPIFPGELHQVEVWASSGMICDNKFHTNCPPDPEDDEEDYLHEPEAHEELLAA